MKDWLWKRPTRPWFGWAMDMSDVTWKHYRFGRVVESIPVGGVKR